MINELMIPMMCDNCLILYIGSGDKDIKEYITIEKTDKTNIKYEDKWGYPQVNTTSI